MRRRMGTYPLHLEDSSSLSIPSIYSHKCSLLEGCKSKRSTVTAENATIIRKRRRPITISATYVLASFVMMAVMDFNFERRFSRCLMVSAFPTLSHSGQRSFSSRDWDQTFPTITNRAVKEIQQATGTRRIATFLPLQKLNSQRAESHRKSLVKHQVATSSSSENTDAEIVDASRKISELKNFWIKLMTGESSLSPLLKKPKWLPKSSRLYKMLPTWIFHLRPSVQLLLTLALYLFHTTILMQHCFVFPFQLIPNDRGNFQSVGYDTLAGIGTLAFYQYLRRLQSKSSDMVVERTSTTIKEVASNTTKNVEEANGETTAFIASAKNTINPMSDSYLPDLISAPKPRHMPWKSVWKSRYSKISSLLTFGALCRAYFYTGRFSLFWEDRLYELARHVSWMTVPMHRSLTVLLGHLSWIAIGALILRTIPRPQPFFQEPISQWFQSNFRQKQPIVDHPSETAEDSITPKQLVEHSSEPARYRQWVWWAIGGYFVSSWLFNITDFINSYAFPLSVLEQAEESSIVAKLVNPEGSDLLASIVGYIAPCITAPWWEEVLYRGFLLPCLLLQMGNNYSLANFLSGIIFSIHHQSELAFLPLCVLGWTWATVYTKSNNLWTTILIHCMWNSRIFLGSWFGL